MSLTAVESAGAGSIAPSFLPGRTSKAPSPGLRSIADTVALLHARYPAGLICVRCALVLATRPESYAKSGLTEAARLAYVCAECGMALAEASGSRPCAGPRWRGTWLPAKRPRTGLIPPRGHLVQSPSTRPFLAL